MRAALSIHGGNSQLLSGQPYLSPSQSRTLDQGANQIIPDLAGWELDEGTTVF